MSRGPKPKPHELAERQGNPGKRPLSKTPDDVPVISETAPKFVREDEMALAVWEQARGHLIRLGFLKRTDEMELGRFCLYFAMWMRLARDVREHGASYVTESQWGTYRRRNPDVGTWLQLGDKIKELGDRFGLTPAARQSIQMKAAAMGRMLPDDPADDRPAAGGEDGGADQPVGLWAPRLPTEQVN